MMEFTYTIKITKKAATLSSYRENIEKKYYRGHISEAMEHVVALKIIARIFS